MSYGYLRENTASYWMDIPASTSAAHYPTDGQGGASQTASLSQLASCAASNPVIVEAVEVRESTAATSIRIKNNANSATLFEIKSNPVAYTQWYPLGGAYGVQVNQGICAAVDNGTTVSGVKIYYRFAGQ